MVDVNLPYVLKIPERTEKITNYVFLTLLDITDIISGQQQICDRYKVFTKAFRLITGMTGLVIR